MWELRGSIHGSPERYKGYKKALPMSPQRSTLIEVVRARFGLKPVALGLQCLQSWTMDMERGYIFSKILQIIGLFGQMGQINYGIFGAFAVELSVHILSLWVPSP